MCDSTLQRVLEVLDDMRIVAEDLHGTHHQVSLLAFSLKAMHRLLGCGSPYTAATQSIG